MAAVLAATTAQAQETIKIGMTQPLTGPVAASGNYVANGAKIAVDVINAKGGVLGKKLELILEDNKSNPKEAVNAVEKLILRDKVPLLIGAWSSTYTLAIMPKLIEYKVPLIVETSSSGKITTSGNPWVFRISPTSEMEAKAFLAQARQLQARHQEDRLSVGQQRLGPRLGRGIQQVSEDQGRAGRLHPVHGAGRDRPVGAADRAQAVRRRYAVRHDRRRADDAGAEAGRRTETASPHHHDRRLVSRSADRESAGPKEMASYHLLFFSPWFPDKAKYPDIAKVYVDEWTKRKATTSPA